MTSYEEARELVRRTCEPAWQHGTFCLDDREIIEDPESFIFYVDARELIVDGDQSYQLDGSAHAVVSKLDGTLSWQPWVALMDLPGLSIRPNPNPTLQV